MNSNIAQSIAFIVLIAGPITFGMLGKPTEMGLCILAASLALAFSNIDKIKRFKGAGFEAEMLEKQIGAMIAKDAEPDVKEDSLSITVESFGLDNGKIGVLRALGNSRYTWRTINGVAQESGLNTNSVKRAIKSLMMNDLVVQAGTAKSANWGLSEEGRKLYNSIKASDGII